MTTVDGSTDDRQDALAVLLLQCEQSHQEASVASFQRLHMYVVSDA